MMKGQRRLNTELAISRSAWADREKKASKREGVRWAGSGKGEEEKTAAANDSGEVEFIRMFTGARRVGSSQSGDSGGEVKENETEPEFHNNRRTFFTVEGRSADIVFQGIKGSFNAPAAGIKVSQIGERKSIRRQIGNEVFINAFRYFETNKPKRDGVFGAGIIKEVKGNIFADVAIVIDAVRVKILF